MGAIGERKASAQVASSQYTDVIAAMALTKSSVFLKGSSPFRLSRRRCASRLGMLPFFTASRL
eukprot:1850852-Pyramimonas_sp.AAC.1